MTNRYRSFSRKLRQLRYVLKQINQITTLGKTVSLKLIHKLRRISKALEPRIGSKRVAQLLGGAALLFASAGSLQAQNLPVLAPGVANTFGLESTPGTYYNLPTFADLDGDGDLDFLTTESEETGEYEYIDNWVYQENTGTDSAPSFGPVQSNPFGLPTGIDMETHAFVDLDGDGDQDIMLTYFDYSIDNYGIGKLLYLENTGSASAPAFAAPIENPFNFQSDEFDPGNVLIPIAGDLDNDGDQDLIIQNFDGRDPEIFGQQNYFYYENTSNGGAVTFADPIANPFGGNLNQEADILFTFFFQLVDLDQDGDLDLVGGGIANYEPVLAYAPNTGTVVNAAFGAREINPIDVDFGAGNTDDLLLLTSFNDIDSDGDLDLFAFDYDGTLFYFQNNLPSNVSEQNAAFELNISPNPTAGLLSIATEETVQRVEVMNIIGRRLLTATTDLQRIDVSGLPNGMYLLKVVTEDNRFTVRKFRKQ